MPGKRAGRCRASRWPRRSRAGGPAAGSRGSQAPRLRPGEQVQDRADLVGEGDPGPQLAVQPIGPPARSEPSRSSGANAPPWRARTMPDRTKATEALHRPAGWPRPPRPDDTGKKSWPAAGLGELLVAPVTVVADGRPVDETSRTGWSAAATAWRWCVESVRDARISRLYAGSSACRRCRPGEVDDAVDAVEAAGVEAAAGGVPLHLVGRARGVADEPHHLVAARTQRGDEGRADQSGRARDGDAAHDVPAADRSETEVGLEGAFLEPLLHRA